MRQKEKLVSFTFLLFILNILIRVVDGYESTPLAVERLEANFLSDGSVQDDKVIQLGASSLNPLNGKHLIAIPSAFEPYMVVTKNTSGYILNVTGPNTVLLEFLAESLHFTFEYYQDYDQLPQFLEDQNKEKPGKISYFSKHEDVDVIIGGFGLSENRNKIIDYAYPTLINSLALMIPKPKSQMINYLVVIWEPFQTQVWFYLAFSIVIGVISLYGIARLSALKKQKNCLKDLNKFSGKKKSIISKDINERVRFKRAMKFILTIIVGQGSAAGGAVGNTRSLVIRFLTGAWCVTCFVLITAFCSVLVSFLTAPEIYKPIIHSVNDLPMKRDIQVTVNKGLFPDIIFRNAVKDEKAASILKFLGKELENKPENRCAKTEKCVEKVRKGSSVYISNDNLMRETINDDWKRTGKCDFTVAKETFLMVLISGILLKKNSPYTEYFNRGFIKMEETGLVDHLINHLNAGDYCLKKIARDTSSKSNSNKKPLTLKSLTSAFVILGIGYALALLSFISELCYSQEKL